MNRRDFLARLGGAAAAITLSPVLDTLPILPAPSVAPVCETDFVAYICWKSRLWIENPAHCGILTWSPETFAEF